MADERAHTGLHERAEQEGGASLERRGADESPRATSARPGDEQELLHRLRSLDLVDLRVEAHETGQAKAFCLSPSFHM